MKSKLFQAAAGGLLMAAGAYAEGDKKAAAPAVVADEGGFCHGVNECGGKGVCGGKTFGEKNSCAGKNSCKGHGVVKMTKKDCDAKKGKFAAKLEH